MRKVRYYFQHQCLKVFDVVGASFCCYLCDFVVVICHFFTFPTHLCNFEDNCHFLLYACYMSYHICSYFPFGFIMQGRQILLTLYHTILTFNDLKEEGFGKHWEREKMVLTSIFSFSHNVFLF